VASSAAPWGWLSVPIYWWAIVHSPVMLAIAVVASRVTGSRQLIMASGTAAALCTLYLAWAAQTNQPGHLKSFASEAPLYFWISTPLALMFVFGLAAAIMRLGIMSMKQKAKPADKALQTDERR
jgi:uncharacterized membrane protein YdcZ (DUF606 family)